MPLCAVLRWASWEVPPLQQPVYVYTLPCLFMCLHCFGVDSSCSIFRESEVQLGCCCSSSSGLHWGRVAGGKHEAQLTCLPSVPQQVVAGSLGLQTSSNKDLDKWSKTSPHRCKEQLQWFIFPDLVLYGWLWGECQNSGLKSLIMKGERRWKMRRWILSIIRVALLDGIFLCTAGKKKHTKENQSWSLAQETKEVLMSKQRFIKNALNRQLKPNSIPLVFLPLIPANALPWAFSTPNKGFQEPECWR